MVYSQMDSNYPFVFEATGETLVQKTRYNTAGRRQFENRTESSATFHTFRHEIYECSVSFKFSHSDTNIIKLVK